MNEVLINECCIHLPGNRQCTTLPVYQIISLGINGRLTRPVCEYHLKEGLMHALRHHPLSVVTIYPPTNHMRNWIYNAFEKE